MWRARASEWRAAGVRSGVVVAEKSELTGDRAVSRRPPLRTNGLLSRGAKNCAPPRHRSEIAMIDSSDDERQLEDLAADGARRQMDAARVHEELASLHGALSQGRRGTHGPALPRRV